MNEPNENERLVEEARLGNVYLWQMTFGGKLQPVKLEASKPEVTRSLPPAAPLGVTAKIYRGPLP